MATTIGRVDFVAGIDGSPIVREARVIAKRAGNAFGKEFGKETKAATAELAASFRELGQQVLRNTPALKRFRDRMAELNNQFRIGGAVLLGPLEKRVRDFAASVQPAVQRVRELGDSIEQWLSSRLEVARIRMGRFGDSIDLMQLRARNAVADALIPLERRFEAVATSVRERVQPAVDRVRDGFEKISAPVRRAGVRIREFAERVREIPANLDRTYPALERVRQAFVNFGQAVLSNPLERWRSTARDVSRGIEETATETEKLTTKMRELDESQRNVDKNSRSLWSRMSFNVRQAIAIVAAIAAGGPEILALGSFVGSSLTIMASAAASLGVGLGVAIAGFKDLGEDAANLPEALRPAREAWQGFVDGLSVLQDTISANLLPQLAEPFQRLADTLPLIEGPLGNIATVIGQVTTQFINMITEASNVQQLQGWLDSTAKVIGFLGDATVKFLDGIGEVFVIAQPFVEDFAKGIDDIAQSFLDWTKSDSGREAITTWFENGQKLAGPLLDLIGRIGESFSRIITPEVIENTAAFLENFASSMDLFEGIMEVFSRADIFGLAAELLATVGNALVPILELIAPIGEILNNVLLVAFNGLAAVLQLLTPLLFPLQVAFEIMNVIFEKLAEQLTPIYQGIQEIGIAIGQELQAALDEILPVIEDVVNEFIALLPPQEEIVAFIRNEMIPWIRDQLGPLLDQWVNWVKDVAAAVKNDLIPWLRDEFVPMMRDKVIPAIERGIEIFNGIAGAIDGMITSIRNVLGWLTDLARKISGMPSLEGARRLADVANGPGMAAGGIVTFGARRLIGEAGPEAVVPLNRPLNMVDPAVRALSAFAQGLDVPASAGGGTGTYVAPGAIVVSTTASAAQTADMVLDRLAVEAQI